MEGNHARHNPHGTGQYNDREAMEIVEIIKNCDTDDIGIISPFKAQAEYIKNIIQKDYPNIEVDTIHKYQGRQKKVIILSTVVNDLKDSEEDFITNFITNPQLLNVAISRAIDKLYLVVSDKVYNSTNNTIAQFIDYIKYYCKSEALNCGKVTSVFDILYTEQAKLEASSKLYKFVDSYAEQIVFDELSKILINYPDYKVIMHYRLSDLLNDYTGFDNDELKYIKNPRTHVDFVIFDKITHKPKVCIEVDGTKYHDYAPKQISHDEIKDRALMQNKIPILRLKTNHSDEINKIIKCL